MGFFTKTLRIAAALLIMSGAASARDLTLVTQRHAGWTELYLSAAAPDLFDTFSVSPSTLTGDSDLVDFGDLRNGTGWLGDVLLEQADITIGASDARFEGMSMMFHPVADKLPMTTPLEGMISIGVCNGPPNGTFVSVKDLHGYVGYFTDVGSAEQPIQIAFHTPLSQTVTVTVHDYDPLGNVATYALDLEPGEPLILRPDAISTPQLSAVLPAAGAAFGVIAMLTVLIGSNLRPNRT